MQCMILRSATKTISIEAPTEKVFSFLDNAANWPSWAIVNVLSVSPAEDGWWHVETPGGMAKLRIRSNSELGTLDHDFNAPDAQ